MMELDTYFKNPTKSPPFTKTLVSDCQLLVAYESGGNTFPSTYSIVFHYLSALRVIPVRPTIIKMSQKNTLFNYFTKSPAAAKVNGENSPSAATKLPEKSNSATPVNKKQPKTPSSHKKESKASTPASGGKKRDAGNVGWVPLVAQYVEKYVEGVRKLAPTKSSEKEKWKEACNEADSALKLSSSERSKLVFDFPDSDADGDGDDETGEDTDKENQNIEEPGKSPPQKKRRVFVLDSEDSEDEYKPKKEDLEVLSESASSGVETDEVSEAEVEESEEGTPVKENKKRKRPSRSKSSKKMKNGETPGDVSSETKSKLSKFPSSENSPANRSSLNLFSSPSSLPVKDGTKSKLALFSSKENSTAVDTKQSASSDWQVLRIVPHGCCDRSERIGNSVHEGRECSFRVPRNRLREIFEQPHRERIQGGSMVKATKFDKVVNREICQVTSRGTKVYSVIDGNPDGAECNYMLALTEKPSGDTVMYGICFVDTSIGIFHMGQFVDDRHLSRLRTLLAHHPPVQVLYERRALSEKTMQLLKSSMASVLKEALASESEFWSANKTLSTLAEGGYFSSESTGLKWPEGLKTFLSEADSLGLSAHDDYELAVRALGACTWYLKSCFLDQQVLSLGQFELYQPRDLADGEVPALVPTNKPSFSRHMVLDGITLTNLDVLEDHSGEREGTLLQKLDLCCTPFGKRLLRQWLCSPLCDIASIKARQEAISCLLNNSSLISEARGLLSQLPDLERLLSRIHTQGNALKSKNHPDSRAIFFEDQTYSKRRILDFLSTLKSFRTAEKIASMFEGFIPNDTSIGCGENEASLVLVTGPNMGGKSTLMRQVGLLVVMAHMGCHVPAASMQLTPVDRIFTRLGANDDIMAGESTFYVELSETSAILHHATKHSLVLVDELGRGTSTYDGTAIAAAVVQELAKMSCRTLFSTHYHTLVESFKDSPLVTLGHMACMVENESEDPSEETVTFLYKFASGACPKSYGFNAARLAGVPANIIRVGYQKAAEIEKQSERRKLFQKIFCSKDGSELTSLIERARSLL
ncbi:hypothetical protein C0J52_01554 [Blattella germanica]|nr:hypothetical protein C0J52_01554 [Blattella germanica]